MTSSLSADGRPQMPHLRQDANITLLLSAKLEYSNYENSNYWPFMQRKIDIGT